MPETVCEIKDGASTLTPLPPTLYLVVVSIWGSGSIPPMGIFADMPMCIRFRVEKIYL